MRISYKALGANGRLGNQLFQIASSLGRAHRAGEADEIVDILREARDIAGARRAAEELSSIADASASEVLQAMADAIGANRVGLRFSPGNPYNGMDVSNPADTFIPLLKAMAPLDLAYLHVLDMGLAELDTLAMVRANSATPIIVNNMLTADTGRALIEAGRADAVSFGRAFIANPDLVARLQAGAPLAKPDYTKLYTGEAQGYIDYPAMDAAAA